MTDIKKLNLRLTADEHAQLVQLAEDEERSINTLVRRMLRAHYAARFGAAPQKARARSKGAR